MPSPPTQSIRECHGDLINHYKDLIYDSAVPDTSRASGKRESVDLHKKFYPIGDLRRIFSIDDVKSILFHDCKDCQQHLVNIKPAHPSQYKAEMILQTDATLSLFALLVFLRHPLLIGTFLISFDSKSLPLPRYLSTWDLMDRYFGHLPRKSREQLVATFQQYKWQFSAPTFDDGSFQLYEQGTILPFLDEVPIGSGGYGRVSRVYVHSYYCKIPVASSLVSGGPPGSVVFARKEIIGEDADEFGKEKTALEKIAALKDDHLVQIKKTYQLGDKFNILFPCARTNLFEYLRDTKWLAPQHVRISQNTLWEQVLGITNALSKIINFPDPDEPDNVIFGYHLDLKPQNILIDNSGPSHRDVFKITDFGQTRFVEQAFAGTSRIHGAAGTDIYAPPEYLENEQDRAYDVWSLGIIVMEVLAYAIRGVDGLLDPEKGLDHVRFTKEKGHSHARFYTGLGSDAIVKPKIVEWMDALLQDPAVQDRDSQQFVQKLLALIVRMLEPQMKRRIPIDQVVEEMAEMFKMKSPKDDEVTAESVKQKDEEILVDLRQVDYYHRGTQGRQSTSVPLRILENSGNRLRIWVGTPLVPVSNQRQEMMVILPSHHSMQVENTAYEIALSSVRDEYAVSLQDGSFVVQNEKEARKMQMALIGHKISERFRIVALEENKYYAPFEKPVSKLVNWVTQPSRSKTEAECNSKGLTPLWIELWVERLPISRPNNRSDLSPLGSSQNRRANRQVNPEAQVPRGRVVIYCKDRIIILSFAKECHIVNQPDMKQLRMRDVDFEPMDKKQCKYFPSAIILASRCQFPGIPMYHPALYELEKRNQVLLESLKLKFDLPEDAYNFYKLYKHEKARWLEQIKGDPARYPSLMP